MILTVEIANNDKFEVLLNFLKVNGYKVKVDSPSFTEDDWITDGRPATDEEIKSLAKAMDEDDDQGTEANLFFNDLIKEINAWK